MNLQVPGDIREKVQELLTNDEGVDTKKFIIVDTLKNIEIQYSPELRFRHPQINQNQWFGAEHREYSRYRSAIFFSALKKKASGNVDQIPVKVDVSTMYLRDNARLFLDFLQHYSDKAFSHEITKISSFFEEKSTLDQVSITKALNKLLQQNMDKWDEFIHEYEQKDEYIF